MENNAASMTPEAAAAAIHDAEAQRATLVGQIVMPRWFFASIGVAVALQTGTMAAGLAGRGVVEAGLLAGGIVVFLVVAGVQLARFRRRNGVWVGGLLSRVVGGTATAASMSYAAALASATWAALAGVWPLVPLCAVAGGAGYTLSGLRWLRSYRADPAAHARGESAAWMAVLVALALAFLVLLVVGS